MTTDELIETLERLEKEATPGPWDYYIEGIYAENDGTDGREHIIWMGNSITDPECYAEGFGACGTHTESQMEQNLELVITLRNHLPALISALKENKRMRELNDEKTNVAILQAEWGAGYDHKVALAARATRHFGGQALIDYLNNTGSGNNAQLVRAFAAVGEAASNPKEEGK